MAPTLACLAGAAVGRMRERGLLTGTDLGGRETPFGRCDSIYRVDDDPAPFYVVPLCDDGDHHVYAGAVNHRANFYALKDLGVQCVVGVAPAGSITHNYNVGEIVLVSDLIDRTTRRAQTFFETCGAGVLRQFPVFCPSVRKALGECLASVGCNYHNDSTLMVTEGPRLETPAEIRWLAAAGGELVSHHFAPEAFLAKELEMCFAGLSYVANYAETGSRYRPFSAKDLFGGLTTTNEHDRVDRTIDIIAGLMAQVSRRLADQPLACECDKTMRGAAKKFGLHTDWRRWFGPKLTAPGAYRPVATREDIASASAEEIS